MKTTCVTLALLAGFVIFSREAAAQDDAASEVPPSVEDRAGVLENPTVEDLPALFEIVRDETHCFPKDSAAVEAIVGLGAEAVPTIVSRVNENRTRPWTSQVSNIYFLALIGPDAESALPALQEIADDPACQMYVRHYARTAIAAIHSDIDALREMIARSDDGDRTRDFGYVALQVLERMGSDALEAAPEIAELARTNLSERSRCLEALEKIDPASAAELAAEITSN